MTRTRTPGSSVAAGLGSARSVRPWSAPSVVTGARYTLDHNVKHDPVFILTPCLCGRHAREATSIPCSRWSNTGPDRHRCAARDLAQASRRRLASGRPGGHRGRRRAADRSSRSPRRPGCTPTRSAGTSTCCWPRGGSPGCRTERPRPRPAALALPARPARRRRSSVLAAALTPQLDAGRAPRTSPGWLRPTLGARPCPDVGRRRHRRTRPSTEADRRPRPARLRRRRATRSATRSPLPSCPYADLVARATRSSATSTPRWSAAARRSTGPAGHPRGRMDVWRRGRTCASPDLNRPDLRPAPGRSPPTSRGTAPRPPKDAAT